MSMRARDRIKFCRFPAPVLVPLPGIAEVGCRPTRGWVRCCLVSIANIDALTIQPGGSNWHIAGVPDEGSHGSAGYGSTRRNFKRSGSRTLGSLTSGRFDGLPQRTASGVSLDDKTVSSNLPPREGLSATWFALVHHQSRINRWTTR